VGPLEQERREVGAASKATVDRPPDDEIPADARVVFSTTFEEEPTAPQEPMRMEELIRASRR
jgi:hypothetical protein